jgi:hypothetical protein
MIEASKYLPAWRKAVTLAAAQAIAEAGWVSEEGPAQVTVSFDFKILISAVKSSHTRNE